MIRKMIIQLLVIPLTMTKVRDAIPDFVKSRTALRTAPYTQVDMAIMRCARGSLAIRVFLLVVRRDSSTINFDRV